MKKEIKKFWQGKVSLGKSFWLWYVVGGTILTLPAWLVPDSSLETTFSALISLISFTYDLSSNYLLLHMSFLLLFILTPPVQSYVPIVIKIVKN